MDKYAQKEDISIMMKSSGLPYTGSKREMLAIVEKNFNKTNAAPLLSRMPQMILANIIRNEKTSASLLSKFRLASKGDIINTILNEIVDEEPNHFQPSVLPTQSTPKSELTFTTQHTPPVESSQSSNPYQDEPSKKLYDMLLSLDKESLQSLLMRFDQAISGNKNEIVLRLINSQNGNPQLIIPMIDLANLQYLASQYGIQRKRLKDEQVSEILEAQFGIVSVAKPIPLQASSVAETKPKAKSKDKEGNLLLDVLDVLDKEALKSALYKLGEPVSGKKDELILRIVQSCDGSPESVLSALDGISLNSIASAYDLPRRRSKDDQMDDLLRDLFGVDKHKPKSEPKATQVIPSTPSRKSTISVKGDAGFDVLVRDIDAWLPTISYASEDGYRADLNAFLSGRGHTTRMEAGDTLVDILVDQNYPIEVKKSPRGGELDRAFGQVFRHLDAYHNVIVVVCKPKFLDELEDFSDRISKYAVLHNHPFILIKKG